MGDQVVSTTTASADSSDDEEEEDVVEVPVMRPKSPPPRVQRKGPRNNGDGPATAPTAAEDAMDIGEPLMHSANSLEPTPSTSSNTVSELRAFRRESNVAVQANMGEASETPNVLDELKASLECPVCSRLSLPPLMACRNGHVTCNACRPKVTSCPICREAEIDSRNMLLEKAFAYLTIPCEYAPHGCQVEIPYRDKESHERVCKFRPFICPYIECESKLCADDVVAHVSTAHRDECRKSEGREITASMILIGSYFGGDGAWSPRVISCFGRTFFDVALTRNRWLHHWVWLLGEEGEAQQYTYEITAFKGNIKYSYGGPVSSLRISDDEIVSDGHCLSISDAIGRRLRDGDKIRYKLKLSERH